LIGDATKPIKELFREFKNKEWVQKKKGKGNFTKKKTTRERWIGLKKKISKKNGKR